MTKADLLTRLTEARDTIQRCWDTGDWSQAVKALEDIDYVLYQLRDMEVD